MKSILLILLALTQVATAQTKVYFSPKGGCTEAVVSELGKAKSKFPVLVVARQPIHPQQV